MLLDHGCDSLSDMIIALTIIQGISLGITFNSMFLMLAIQTSFYLATWEEYHTHCCRTQIFNWGVTESQCMVMAVLIISGIFGTEIYKTEIIFGINI